MCPNAVGVDIGCGMNAVPVDGLFKGDLSRKQMLAIQERIKQWIPTGSDPLWVLFSILHPWQAWYCCSGRSHDEAKEQVIFVSQP